jgi:hypothetical protein
MIPGRIPHRHVSSSFEPDFFDWLLCLHSSRVGLFFSMVFSRPKQMYFYASGFHSQPLFTPSQERSPKIRPAKTKARAMAWSMS